MMACFSMTPYLQKPQEVSPVSSLFLKKTTRRSIRYLRASSPLITTACPSSRLSIKASTTSDPVIVRADNNSEICIRPWLMLTPEMDPSSSGAFKFYSLARDDVITIEQRTLQLELGFGYSGKVDLEFKGSSHGWLAVFDRLSCDLFLYNPQTNRHVKLPTIRNLAAISEDDLEWGDFCVTKVIISSPNPLTDPDCCALMIYGLDDHLAFCCPSSSSEWIEMHHCSYDDVVQCGVNSDNSMLFFGVTCHCRDFQAYPEFHAWDLRDLSRPKLISLEDRLVKDFGGTFPWKGYGFRRPVEDEEANFLVASPPHCYPQKLFYVGLDLKNMDFHVHKFDFEKGKLVRMDRSLDGLAFFLGRNDSFALSAADFPQLKPNSIYFVNPEDECEGSSDLPLGKIYNYEDGTFSPAPIYTVKDSSGHTPPMWYAAKYPYVV